MTVQSDSATKSEKEIVTKWPITTGLELGTTKIAGRQINLVAEGILGVSSIVPSKEKRGCKMKNNILILIGILVFLLGILLGWLVLSTNVTKIVEVEKECDTISCIECDEVVPNVVYTCTAHEREFYDSVLEVRQEELAEGLTSEIRPANYVAHCDRAGVVC